MFPKNIVSLGEPAPHQKGSAVFSSPHEMSSVVAQIGQSDVSHRGIVHPTRPPLCISPCFLYDDPQSGQHLELCPFCLWLEEGARGLYECDGALYNRDGLPVQSSLEFYEHYDAGDSDLEDLVGLGVAQQPPRTLYETIASAAIDGVLESVLSQLFVAPTPHLEYDDVAYGSGPILDIAGAADNVPSHSSDVSLDLADEKGCNPKEAKLRNLETRVWDTGDPGLYFPDEVEYFEDGHVVKAPMDEVIVPGETVDAMARLIISVASGDDLMGSSQYFPVAGELSKFMRGGNIIDSSFVKLKLRRTVADIAPKKAVTELHKDEYKPLDPQKPRTSKRERNGNPRRANNGSHEKSVRTYKEIEKLISLGRDRFMASARKCDGVFESRSYVLAAEKVLGLKGDATPTLQAMCDMEEVFETYMGPYALNKAGAEPPASIDYKLFRLLRAANKMTGADGNTRKRSACEEMTGNLLYIVIKQRLDEHGVGIDGYSAALQAKINKLAHAYNGNIDASPLVGPFPTNSKAFVNLARVGGKGGLVGYLDQTSDHKHIFLRARKFAAGDLVFSLTVTRKTDLGSFVTKEDYKVPEGKTDVDTRLFDEFLEKTDAVRDAAVRDFDSRKPEADRIGVLGVLVYNGMRSGDSTVFTGTSKTDRKIARGDHAKVFGLPVATQTQLRLQKVHKSLDAAFRKRLAELRLTHALEEWEQLEPKPDATERDKIREVNAALRLVRSDEIAGTGFLEVRADPKALSRVSMQPDVYSQICQLSMSEVMAHNEVKLKILGTGTHLSQLVSPPRTAMHCRILDDKFNNIFSYSGNFEGAENELSVEYVEDELVLLIMVASEAAQPVVTVSGSQEKIAMFPVWDSKRGHEAKEPHLRELLGVSVLLTTDCVYVGVVRGMPGMGLNTLRFGPRPIRKTGGAYRFPRTKFTATTLNEGGQACKIACMMRDIMSGMSRNVREPLRYAHTLTRAGLLALLGLEDGHAYVYADEEAPGLARRVIDRYFPCEPAPPVRSCSVGANMKACYLNIVAKVVQKVTPKSFAADGENGQKTLDTCKKALTAIHVTSDLLFLGIGAYTYFSQQKNFENIEWVVLTQLAIDNSETRISHEVRAVAGPVIAIMVLGNRLSLSKSAVGAVAGLFGALGATTSIASLVSKNEKAAMVSRVIGCLGQIMVECAMVVCEENAFRQHPITQYIVPLVETLAIMVGRYGTYQTIEQKFDSTFRQVLIHLAMGLVRNFVPQGEAIAEILHMAHNVDILTTGTMFEAARTALLNQRKRRLVMKEEGEQMFERDLYTDSEYLQVEDDGPPKPYVCVNQRIAEVIKPSKWIAKLRKLRSNKIKVDGAEKELDVEHYNGLVPPQLPVATTTVAPCSLLEVAQDASKFSSAAISCVATAVNVVMAATSSPKPPVAQACATVGSLIMTVAGVLPDSSVVQQPLPPIEYEMAHPECLVVVEPKAEDKDSDDDENASTFEPLDVRHPVQCQCPQPCYAVYHRCSQPHCANQVNTIGKDCQHCQGDSEMVEIALQPAPAEEQPTVAVAQSAPVPRPADPQPLTVPAAKAAATIVKICANFRGTERCRNTAQPGGNLCVMHAKALTEQRRRAAAKASNAVASPPEFASLGRGLNILRNRVAIYCRRKRINTRALRLSLYAIGGTTFVASSFLAGPALFATSVGVTLAGGVALLAAMVTEKGAEFNDAVSQLRPHQVAAYIAYFAALPGNESLMAALSRKSGEMWCPGAIDDAVIGIINIRLRRIGNVAFNEAQVAHATLGKAGKLLKNRVTLGGNQAHYNLGNFNIPVTVGQKFCEVMTSLAGVDDNGPINSQTLQHRIKTECCVTGQHLHYLMQVAAAMVGGRLTCAAFVASMSAAMKGNFPVHESLLNFVSTYQMDENGDFKAFSHTAKFHQTKESGSSNTLAGFHLDHKCLVSKPLVPPSNSAVAEAAAVCGRVVGNCCRSSSLPAQREIAGRIRDFIVQYHDQQQHFGLCRGQVQENLATAKVDNNTRSLVNMPAAEPAKVTNCDIKQEWSKNPTNVRHQLEESWAPDHIGVMSNTPRGVYSALDEQEWFPTKGWVLQNAAGSVWQTVMTIVKSAQTHGFRTYVGGMDRFEMGAHLASMTEFRPFVKFFSGDATSFEQCGVLSPTTVLAAARAMHTEFNLSPETLSACFKAVLENPGTIGGESFNVTESHSLCSGTNHTSAMAALVMIAVVSPRYFEAVKRVAPHSTAFLTCMGDDHILVVGSDVELSEQETQAICRAMTEAAAPMFELKVEATAASSPEQLMRSDFSFCSGRVLQVRHIETEAGSRGNTYLLLPTFQKTIDKACNVLAKSKRDIDASWHEKAAGCIMNGAGLPLVRHTWRAYSNLLSLPISQYLDNNPYSGWTGSVYDKFLRASLEPLAHTPQEKEWISWYTQRDYTDLYLLDEWAKTVFDQVRHSRAQLSLLYKPLPRYQVSFDHLVRENPVVKVFPQLVECTHPMISYDFLPPCKSGPRQYELEQVRARAQAASKLESLFRAMRRPREPVRNLTRALCMSDRITFCGAIIECLIKRPDLVKHLVPATSQLNGWHGEYTGSDDVEEYISILSADQIYHVFTLPTSLNKSKMMVLAVLGDGVLGVCAVERLIRMYDDPGEITIKKAQLVSNDALGALYNLWNFERFFDGGGSGIAGPARKHRADSVEALAGMLHTVNPAKAIRYCNLVLDVVEQKGLSSMENHSGLVNVHAARCLKLPVVYHYLAASGVTCCRLEVGGFIVAFGEGLNKKGARADAARCYTRSFEGCDCRAHDRMAQLNGPNGTCRGKDFVKRTSLALVLMATIVLSSFLCFAFDDQNSGAQVSDIGGKRGLLKSVRSDPFFTTKKMYTKEDRQLMERQAGYAMINRDEPRRHETPNYSQQPHHAHPANESDNESEPQDNVPNALSYFVTGTGSMVTGVVELTVLPTLSNVVSYGAAGTAVNQPSLQTAMQGSAELHVLDNVLANAGPGQPMTAITNNLAAIVSHDGFGTYRVTFGVHDKSGVTLWLQNRIVNDASGEGLGSAIEYIRQLKNYSVGVGVVPTKEVGTYVFVFDRPLDSGVPFVSLAGRTWEGLNLSRRLYRSLSADPTVFERWLSALDTEKCPFDSSKMFDYVTPGDPYQLKDDDDGASLLSTLTHRIFNFQFDDEIVLTGAPINDVETLYLGQKQSFVEGGLLETEQSLISGSRVLVCTDGYSGTPKHVVRQAVDALSFAREVAVKNAEVANLLRKAAMPPPVTLHEDNGRWTVQTVFLGTPVTKRGRDCRHTIDAALTACNLIVDKLPYCGHVNNESVSCAVAGSEEMAIATYARDRVKKVTTSIIEQVSLLFELQPNPSHFTGNNNYNTQQSGVVNIKMNDGVATAASPVPQGMLSHIMIYLGVTSFDQATNSDVKDRVFFMPRICAAVGGGTLVPYKKTDLTLNGVPIVANPALFEAIRNCAVICDAGQAGSNVVALQPTTESTGVFNGYQNSAAAVMLKNYPRIPIRDTATWFMAPVGLHYPSRRTMYFSSSDITLPVGTTTALKDLPNWSIDRTQPVKASVVGVPNGSSQFFVNLAPASGFLLCNAVYGGTLQVDCGNLSIPITACTGAAGTVIATFQISLVTIYTQVDETGAQTSYTKSVVSNCVNFSSGLGVLAPVGWSANFSVPITGMLTGISLTVGTVLNNCTMGIAVPVSPSSTGGYFSITMDTYDPCEQLVPLIRDLVNGVQAITSLSMVGSTPVTVRSALTLPVQESDVQALIALGNMEIAFPDIFKLGICNIHKTLKLKPSEVVVPMDALPEPTLVKVRATPGDDTATSGIIDTLMPFVSRLLPIGKSIVSSFLNTGGSSQPAAAQQEPPRRDMQQEMLSRILERLERLEKPQSAIRNKTVRKAVDEMDSAKELKDIYPISEMLMKSLRLDEQRARDRLTRKQQKKLEKGQAEKEESLATISPAFKPPKHKKAAKTKE